VTNVTVNAALIGSDAPMSQKGLQIELNFVAVQDSNFWSMLSGQIRNLQARE
jgi:hypothetical protein